MHLLTLLFGKQRKIVNEVYLKFQFYSENLSFSPLNLCCKPPIFYELQTEKKQLRLILHLQNNLVNSLMFVYQDITELLYIFQ